MARRKNPFIQLLVRYASLGFLRLTRIMPMPFNRLLAAILTETAYRFVPRIRDVGRANLDLAYGDSLEPRVKNRILRSAIANVLTVVVEFSRLPMMAQKNFKGRVEIRGQEHLDMDKGFLAIGAHFGNWEWMAPAIASCGYKVAEVVRPFDDPALNARIDGLRTGGHVTTIPKDDAGRSIIRLLKEGWIVGVLVDQSPRENGVPVDFFGQPCWATIAPAMIAARSKAPVHPVAMHRTGPGNYVLEFYPALNFQRSEDLRADLVQNTQRCQDTLERLIREHPEQWLWFHRRWKKRERLDREWKERQQKAAKRTQDTQASPGKDSL